MNNIKHCFLKILQGNITYEGNVVPVVIKDYWVDKTPCVNIYGRPYKVKRSRHHRTEHLKLPKTHNLFDTKNPNKKYPTLVEYNKHGFKIILNVWCNNEKERTIITKQINNLLFLCMNNHHKFCTRFNNKNNSCSTTQEKCSALSDIGYHGLRGQCSDAEKYDFCNILDCYGVIRNSIELYPDYEDDPYGDYPPLKHTIKEIDLKYYDKRIVRSNPTLSMNINF